MNNEIDGEEFLKSRKKELNEFFNRISSTKKKKMLFQTLPYYKRRRTRSHIRKFKKKKCNSVIYFSKRFSMINMYGYKVALKNRLKSDSYIYKSLERGFFMDASFRKIFLNQKFCLEESGMIRKNECKHDEDFDSFKNYDVFYVLNFKYDPGYYKIRNNKLLKIEMPCISISDEIIIIVYTNETIFLVHKKYTMSLIQILIYNGHIPIGIHEYFRICLELKKLTFFDNNLSIFKEYENEVSKLKIEKYNRTPKSKRVNYDKLNIYSPFKIPEFEGSILFFESDKIFDRCDVIYGLESKLYQKLCNNFKKMIIQECIGTLNSDTKIKIQNNEITDIERYLINLKYSEKLYEKKLNEFLSNYLFENNKISGYVIRGLFCYSIGRGRGVCIVAYNSDYHWYARNVNSKKSYKIEIFKDNL